MLCGRRSLARVRYQVPGSGRPTPPIVPLSDPAGPKI